MRSHGGGRLCYDLRAPMKCAPCRASNARSHANHNRSDSHKAANWRYETSAKGMLARARAQAKVRKS